MVWRRHLLSFVCLAAAGLIGVAAIVDHAWKVRRTNQIELAEWYCEHKGVDCGGPSWQAMERRWNNRQIGYEVAVVGLAGLAVVRVALRTRRR